MRRQTASLGAAILLSAGTCLPQASSTISLSNGVELQITANLGQPTGAESLKIELARASGDSFYRIFWDQNNLAVFAYELAVSRSAGDTFSIVAKPATTGFAARFPNADGGKPVPTLSADRPLRTLHSGERSSIELFEIPGMGLHVIETVRVVLNPDGSAESGGPLRFADLKISINGTPVSGAGPRGAVSGRYVMFYLPGRGGYFFSTDAPAAHTFVKAGIVDRNRMQFNVDNENFDCVADAPILAQGDTGEVWVYHDPTYQPAGNWTRDPRATSDQFFTAASDSLNWWLP